MGHPWAGGEEAATSGASARQGRSPVDTQSPQYVLPFSVTRHRVKEDDLKGMPLPKAFYFFSLSQQAWC